MADAAPELVLVLGKWLTVPTPNGKKLLAKMLGLHPRSVSAENAVPTVRIEANGSGAVLVRALPLPDGTKCQLIEEMISKQLEGYPRRSYFLMLGHGGRELKERDVIPPGTATLVLANVPIRNCRQIQKWFRYWSKYWRIYRRHNLSDSRNFGYCNYHERQFMAHSMCLRDTRNLQYCFDCIKIRLPFAFWVTVILRNARCYEYLPNSYKTDPLVGVYFASLLRRKTRSLDRMIPNAIKHELDSKRDQA